MVFIPDSILYIFSGNIVRSVAQREEEEETSTNLEIIKDEGKKKKILTQLQFLFS
jgi:hypothetical protein